MAHRTLWLALIASSVVLLVSCGGNGDEPGGAPGVSLRRAPVAAHVWLSLLQHVPDAPRTRSQVFMNDIAHIREVFQVPLPGPDDSQESLERYLLTVAGGLGSNMPQPRIREGPFISGLNAYALQTMGNLQKYLAFDIRNVDQTVQAGVPPGRLEIVRGRFDPRATDRALISCSECPEATRKDYRGISFYSWGEDLQTDLRMRLGPPAFDELGRGGRIAVQRDYVFRTVETPGMRALIDAATGGDSLAQVEEYRLLAQGLEELSAYAVLLSDLTQTVKDVTSGLGGSMTAARLEELKQQLLKGPLLEPYQLLATGAGMDSRGQYMAVVLVHEDEAAARSNVTLLRRRVKETASLLTGQPWGERVQEVEVRYQGRVLLAKLRGERAITLWPDFIYQHDPLLLHK